MTMETCWPAFNILPVFGGSGSGFRGRSRSDDADDDDDGAVHYERHYGCGGGQTGRRCGGPTDRPTAQFE